MKRRLISELWKNISPKFITNTAQTFQETEVGISNGLKNFIPTILYQLDHHLDSSRAKEFFQILKNEKHTSFTNHLNGASDSNVSPKQKDIANTFTEKLFGKQEEGIVNFVSQENQLRSNSSQALMTVSSTLILGYFSKLIRKEGLNLHTFKQFLSGQHEEIVTALPVGMMNWVGGIRPISSATSSAAIAKTVATSNGEVATAAAASAATDTAASSGASLGFAKWLLLLIPLLFCFWFFSRDNSTNTSKDTIAKSQTPKTTQPVVEESNDDDSEDALAQATLAQAEINKTETSSEESNNATPKVKGSSDVKKKIAKKSTQEEVIIYPPKPVQDEVVEVFTSPGKVVNPSEFNSRGQSSNTSSGPVTASNIKQASTEIVVPPAEKISYDEYMAKVKTPEPSTVALDGIEQGINTNLPSWYKESKKVANGNSGNVSIKKMETMLESRNTSQLAALRKTLSLTVYNAWFGHTSNPISSTEYRLYNYLKGMQGTGNEIDKYTWFNLDEVKYKGLSSRMDYDASKGQLTRIASILKAHPDAQVRIGGFTSDQGRKKANRKLSLEMAEQAKSALEDLGVQPERISVKGYGESNPLALNDTDYGKMLNHRVGIRIMSK